MAANLKKLMKILEELHEDLTMQSLYFVLYHSPHYEPVINMKILQMKTIQLATVNLKASIFIQNISYLPYRYKVQNWFKNKESSGVLIRRDFFTPSSEYISRQAPKHCCISNLFLECTKITLSNFQNLIIENLESSAKHFFKWKSPRYKKKSMSCIKFPSITLNTKLFNKQF